MNVERVPAILGLSPVRDRGCQACGAPEAEVHRVGCSIWMNSRPGMFSCPHCGGSFAHLINGLCGVCEYWDNRLRSQHEGGDSRDRARI